MNHIEPTYLRFVYDKLEKGILNSENPSSLPDGFVGIYEQEFVANMPVNERQNTLLKFGLWALFKSAVSIETFSLIFNIDQSEARVFIDTYSNWFNSPEPGKYQLYHDRIKVFFLQKLKNDELQELNEQLISVLLTSIKTKNGDSTEQYALEHLSSHMALESMMGHEYERLHQFVNNESMWTRQIDISNGYQWSQKAIQHGIKEGARRQDELNTLRSTVNSVKLMQQEQNSAEDILRLLNQGDYLTALGRAERWEGERQFKLYLLMIHELTLGDCKEANFKTKVCEIILEKFRETSDNKKDFNTSNFYSPYYIYQYYIALDRLNIDAKVLLERGFMTSFDIFNDDFLLSSDFLSSKYSGYSLLEKVTGLKINKSKLGYSYEKSFTKKLVSKRYDRFTEQGLKDELEGYFLMRDMIIKKFNIDDLINISSKIRNNFIKAESYLNTFNLYNASNSDESNYNLINKSIECIDSYNTLYAKVQTLNKVLRVISAFEGSFKIMLFRNVVKKIKNIPENPEFEFLIEALSEFINTNQSNEIEILARDLPVYILKYMTDKEEVSVDQENSDEVINIAYLYLENQIDKALKSTLDIKTDSQRNFALEMLSNALIKEGDYDAACNIISNISEPLKKEESYVMVGFSMINKGLVENGILFLSNYINTIDPEYNLLWYNNFDNSYHLYNEILDKVYKSRKDFYDPNQKNYWLYSRYRCKKFIRSYIDFLTLIGDKKLASDILFSSEIYDNDERTKILDFILSFNSIKNNNIHFRSLVLKSLTVSKQISPILDFHSNKIFRHTGRNHPLAESRQGFTQLAKLYIEKNKLNKLSAIPLLDVRIISELLINNGRLNDALKFPLVDHPSPTDHIFTSTVKYYISHGQIDEAEDLLNKIKNIPSRNIAVINIAKFLISTDGIDHSWNFILKNMNFKYADKGRNYLIKDFINSCFSICGKEKSLVFIKNIDNDIVYIDYLKYFNEKIGEDEANKLIKMIKNSEKKELALIEICPILTSKGTYKNALKLISNFTKVENKIYGLLNIMHLLNDTDQQKVISYLYEFSHQIKRPSIVMQIVYNPLFNILFNQNKFDEIKNIPDNINISNNSRDFLDEIDLVHVKLNFNNIDFWIKMVLNNPAKTNILGKKFRELTSTDFNLAIRLVSLVPQKYLKKYFNRIIGYHINIFDNNKTIEINQPYNINIIRGVSEKFIENFELNKNVMPYLFRFSKYTDFLPNILIHFSKVYSFNNNVENEDKLEILSEVIDLKPLREIYSN
mgnify:CR=1 FL=1